jgi:hypothetical protein
MGNGFSDDRTPRAGVDARFRDAYDMISSFGSDIEEPKAR